MIGARGKERQAVVKKIDTCTLRERAKGNAIAKVCAVLSTLSARSPLRLNEISELTGLNRVTALRILEDLGEAGFVARSGNPPRYDFGPEVVAMAAAASRSFNLREIARPSLLRLAELTGDTVLLSLRSGAEAVVVDRAVGDYPIRANFLDIGSRRALGIGGGSMALLASLPAPERDAILDMTCKRLDDYPQITRSVLEAHIEQLREQGYVTMLDIVVNKMGAIGLPLMGRNGELLGAISIVALSERISERREMLVNALNAEARVISRHLPG